MIFVNSSNVRNIGYDADHSIMQVDYTTGERYQYFDIPMKEYETVLFGRWGTRYRANQTHSVGKALHRYIKEKGFRFIKISI